MAARLTFLGPVREGGGATVVLSGAPAYAGVVWRVTDETGSISGAMTRANAAGIASARYDAGDGVDGDPVAVEADVYG